MYYTPAEQVRQQMLNESEATLVDLAKYLEETSFLTTEAKLHAVHGVAVYATAEGFSKYCTEWLQEIHVRLLRSV